MGAFDSPAERLLTVQAVTAVLAGWNIGILIVFIGLIALASVVSFFTENGLDRGPAAVAFTAGCAALGALVGWLGAKRVYPYFRSRTRGISYAWFVVLIVLTYFLFPQPYTYIIF